MPRRRTFISYSRQDAQAVRALLGQAVMRGISPWIDMNNILRHAGQDLDQVLTQAIEEEDMACLTLFVSERSAASDWVRREVAWAVTLGKRIIVILLTDTDRTRAALDELFHQAGNPGVNPLYLHAGDANTALSWLRSVLDAAGCRRPDDLVLYLGHRLDHAGLHDLPEDWGRLPVIDLRAREFGEQTMEQWGFRDWCPASGEEYREYEQALGDLLKALGGTPRRLMVCGYTSQGMAVLAGKVFDRGGGVREIITLNRNETWRVEARNPPAGAPGSWHHLEARPPERIGQGDAVLVGHFSNDGHFATLRAWAEAGKEELHLGQVIHLRTPLDFNADVAGELAVEIVQSLEWAKDNAQAPRVYWACGLPVALLPLVSFLLRSRNVRVTFLDYDRAADRYVQACELF